ncbi:acyl-CoA dehydrogenase [Aeromicrobium sp. SMF47]|uniref:acyl-CoA dehydrogenase family protein n=1 Tax=Aeromicrobium TaxID=2040 RepID=UPI00129E86E9|nr:MULTISPECIES: acyl-CoA dehydrogenase family protein [Aeromicrobium]MRJ77002.1 acyl-CoA dehydrogenase [Aeromicrobium yanjiei]MRK01344.1 acyl-CoA dehydrogenase [Aeromicrobium sp. S22]
MTLTDPVVAQTTTITDDDVLSLATQVGREAAAYEAVHDHDATFVSEAYDLMKSVGYLGLPVPVELGGRGASMRQMVLAQEELGRWSGAAALSSTMHLYLTFVQRFRHRKGAPDAAGVLTKVARDGLVMATSGGSDWVSPSTVATQVDGGYELTGRKVFCSQAPAADVLSTCGVLGEPGPDATVLHMGVPMSSPGISVVETWDTLGMRGTASHDIVFDRVFVPAEKIVGTRPYGSLSGPLLVAVIHFCPLGGAAYLGVAHGALDEATRVARSRGEATASAIRQVGDMTARLRTARWALLGAVDEMGDDPTMDEATLETVLTAKRQAVVEARTIADTALEVAGGGAFFRSSPLERAYRDVRGGPFHPLPPEATLELIGRRALSD